MDKLALVRRLCSECGITDSGGPSTTLAQTGEYLRAVNWVDQANSDIQNTHSTYEFLRTEFSGSISGATNEYTAAALGITDFGTWEKNDFRVYSAISDESIVCYVPWAEFRMHYMLGTARTQTGRPIVFTVKPDKKVRIFPVPDAAYTLVGEYFKAPIAMADDDDEPPFPEQFHMGVVWRAMMFYGSYSSEADKYAMGKDEYKKVIRGLERDQLPPITWAEPIA